MGTPMLRFIAGLLLFVMFSGAFRHAGAGQDGGYEVLPGIWEKATLDTAAGSITLKWQAIGTDATPSGDRVVSGYFYADPADFAYGSRYNPEVFVKMYVAANGWANIAFNHVTVDDVTVMSAQAYDGQPDQTGTATLTSRLVEHQYNGVTIQQQEANDGFKILAGQPESSHPPTGIDAFAATGTHGGGDDIAAALWAQSVLLPSSGPVSLKWRLVGADTTPSGDRVVSGYFYADPADFAYGSEFNPEVFVKVYIASNGWANLAFNHVTVDDVTVATAHEYVGVPDQTGAVTLKNRLLEHQYAGVQSGDHGTISVSVPDIAGTDGSIIYGGQVHTDTLTVPDNALMAVLKGEDVYFYHPALGTRTLSEETSQLAIGYFIAMGQAVQMATDFQANSLITWDHDLLLGTKILFHLGSEERSTIVVDPDDPGKDLDAFTPETLYIKNALRRWVAVKSHPLRDGIVLYLPPRETLFDTISNVIASGQACFEALGVEFSMANLLGANVDNLSLPSDGVYPFEQPSHAPIATFGSMIRCVPAFYEADVAPATIQHIIDTVTEAALKDPDTFMRVNLIDLVQMVSDAIDSVLGVVVQDECLEASLKKMFNHATRTELIAALTGDFNVRNAYWCKDLQDLGHDLSMCVLELADVPIPVIEVPVSAVAKVISMATDTITALRFAFDDVLLAKYAVTDSDAYATFEFPEVSDELEYERAVHCRTKNDGGGTLSVDTNGNPGDDTFALCSYYDSGWLKAESPYTDGQLNGTFLFFYENGQIKIESPYVAGKNHGIYISYYQNGRVDEVRPYRDGKLHGTNKKYFENRTLRFERPYVNGLKQGNWIIYYENGMVYNEQQYAADKLDGVVRIYYEDGQVEEESTYSAGQRNGVYTEYYEDGVPKTECEYKDDQLNGVRKTYYESGQLKTECTYTDGLKNGVHKTYGIYGQVADCWVYENDVRTGPCE